MYYLGSRYYDPQVGRFINADDVSVIGASPMELTDKNLFAYCDNNPVMRKDDGGDFWHIIAGAVIGGAFEIGSQLLSGKSITEINWGKVGVATLAGGVTAALGPWAGAGVNGIANVALDAIDGKQGSQLIGSFVIGAGSSLLGSGVQKIGGKIATNALKNTSKANIKKVISGICDLNGVERNIYKTSTNWTKGISNQINKHFGMRPASFYAGQATFNSLNLACNRIRSAYGR